MDLEGCDTGPRGGGRFDEARDATRRRRLANERNVDPDQRLLGALTVIGMLLGLALLLIVVLEG